ncbi:MAG: glycosyltransferase, partial [Puniceicoccales bacterium]|nr:glycosyltransferase [Puniceicoccales bacterium]
TDGSLAILKSYAQKYPRIKVLENGQNRGLLFTRIRATLAAEGEYILCLDSDDELFPNIAEKALAAAKGTGADIVFFQVEEIKRDGKRSLARWLCNVPITGTARDAAEIPIMIEKEKMLWHLWGRLWRAEMIRNTAARFLDFASRNHIIYAEDMLLFYFTVKKAASYAVISDVGHRYFRSHGGICHRNDPATAKKKFADLEIVRRAIAADSDDWPGKKHFLRRIAK